MTDGLTAEERAVYEWQIWSPDFGEEGQRKLKNSCVLISRCGGLGSVVAYELAAAGIGRLIIAHAGNVKPSDLNRQLLMTHDWIGKPRLESICRRLLDLNPRLDILPVDRNLDPQLADELVPSADVCVGAAPLFEERFALNDACVKHGKPLVDCAMYDCDLTIQTYAATGQPCLRCLCPTVPDWWKREFPVFGAVSGTVACLGAMEVIKLISGIGAPLEKRMLVADLRNMKFREMKTRADPDCKVCGRNAAGVHDGR